MSLITIAERDPVHRQRLVTALAGAALGDVEVTETLQDALEHVQTRDAAVLLVGPSLVGDPAFELAEHLASEGRTATVFVAPGVDAELLRRALRSGVSDVLGAADPGDDIVASVRRALTSSGRSRAIAEAQSSEPERTAGKVVTVFSTKGGVGKTVLATNLGVALARDTGKRVALIDLDLEFGDVAIMLGIEPCHTIYDAVQVFDRLDADLLGGFMETHSSGLRLLLAPVRPEDAEAISAARVGQIIDLVRDHFDYVVIDTCPAFSEAVLMALDRSDEVYVVTMMDVASIKNTRISLQKLRQLGYADGRVQLVLNRSDSKVLLQPAEVEAAVGGRISAHIPSDRAIPRSVNKGVPIVIEMPRSEVARSMLAIARGAAEPVGKGASDVA